MRRVKDELVATKQVLERTDKARLRAEKGVDDLRQQLAELQARDDRRASTARVGSPVVDPCGCECCLRNHGFRRASSSDPSASCSNGPPGMLRRWCSRHRSRGSRLEGGHVLGTSAGGAQGSAGGDPRRIRPTPQELLVPSPPTGTCRVSPSCPPVERVGVKLPRTFPVVNGWWWTTRR